ncbi:hypothetical protein AVEN_269539-1 [Araneus ventricosus]|uniref:Uncharacterized protein n=1 Tax=Araneus ventricosus TaxID=182803 RepID=A0A4Y2CDH7_ARAVE|nr:hypothetical protein AVEN_269539-1 [Araneus ventricosus]
MSKRHSSSRQVFFNMSSVTVHTAACILAFSSSTLAMVRCGKDSVLDIAPKEKIKRSNIRKVQSQSVGPSLPIHRSGNVSSMKSRTKEPQSEGAPSC